VQKSYDIANWDIIAKIDGAGNSNKLSNNGFTDEKPTQKSYYRLKQVDLMVSLNIQKSFQLIAISPTKPAY
jgi:hypothetical protein